MKTKRFATVTIFACAMLLATHSAKAFYNPSTGRWLSRDPAGELGGRNLSAFLNNNAANQIDLFGLCKDDPDSDPTEEPCKGKWKTLYVITRVLSGSNADVEGDIRKANDIFAQCCIKVVSRAPTVPLDDARTKAILGPDGVLSFSLSANAYPQAEEAKLFGLFTQNAVNVYYVPGAGGYGGPLDRGVRGYAYTKTYYSQASNPPPWYVLFLTNDRADDSLARELGHITGDWDAYQHRNKEPNNLMCGKNRTGDYLDPGQCDKINKFDLLK